MILFYCALGLDPSAEETIEQESALGSSPSAQR
jgi:hypothetical protein